MSPAAITLVVVALVVGAPTLFYFSTGLYRRRPSAVRATAETFRDPAMCVAEEWTEVRESDKRVVRHAAPDLCAALERLRAAAMAGEQR